MYVDCGHHYLTVVVVVVMVVVVTMVPWMSVSGVLCFFGTFFGPVTAITRKFKQIGYISMDPMNIDRWFVCARFDPIHTGNIIYRIILSIQFI